MFRKIIRNPAIIQCFFKVFSLACYIISSPSLLLAQEAVVLPSDLQSSSETLPLIILIFILLFLMFFMVSLKLLTLHKKLYNEQLSSERLFEMLSMGPDGYYAFIYYPDALITDYNLGYKLASSNDEAVKTECSRTLALMLGLSAGIEAGFPQVAEKFKDEDRRLLVKNVDDLRRYGNSFSGIYRTHNDEKIFRIKGNRATSDNNKVLCDIIWIRDVSLDFAKIDKLEKELSIAKSSRNMNRAMLDALPSPVWLRGDDLSIIWCNQAYAKTIDAPSNKEASLKSEELIKGEDARKLRALAASARASREKKSKQIHVVIGGKRRLIEINEIPFDPLEYGITEAKNQLYTAGIAYDITQIEEVENNAEIITKQNNEVWKNINTAVAIFDNNTNLIFYNPSFIKIWELDEDQLTMRLSYGAFLDLLRDKRMLPEITSDYNSFKNNEIKNLTSLITSKEELLHLSSGITIRRITIPHHLGGVMIIYEDITDKLAMERSYNTLLEVQNDTLSHLHEAVAVFGSDGRLKLSNPAYSELWKIGQDVLNKNPSINQVIEWQSSFFADAENWEELKEEMLQKLTDRFNEKIKIDRSDAITLESKSVALPDGGILITYVDITDKERIEKILKEQNHSMKAASRMRTRFLASVSDEFKEPLGEIMSCSEYVEKQVTTPKIKLSKKTKDSIAKIYENAKNLKENINNIIDLASIEAGQMPLSLNTFDINQMLNGVIAMTTNKIKKRQMELVLICPNDIGWIVGDEKRIKQALYYMIGYTVNATSIGNKITLTTTRELYQNKGECVIFAIASIFDKTPSFPEFENGETDGWYELDGMGYNMVKKFVEQHNGIINIKKGKNNITSIYIVLPTNS